MYPRGVLEAALEALGELVADRGEAHVVVAIGGGALSLLGLMERATEDVDLVGVIKDGTLIPAQPLPTTLRDAVADIAALRNLQPKWMNGEPTSLLQRGLPEGFLARCERRQFGGLTVLLASRFDQIHLKLYAVSGPHDKHYADLRRLQPTRDELTAAATWVRRHSVSEDDLRNALDSFGVTLDDV